MTASPQISDRADAHRYEMTLDGKQAAHIEYRMRGNDVIDLVHTEVDKAFEGQGLGSKIAKYALDDARSRGLKVIPSCSYIAGWIQKHPDYADLVTSR